MQYTVVEGTKGTFLQTGCHVYFKRIIMQHYSSHDVFNRPPPSLFFRVSSLAHQQALSLSDIFFLNRMKKLKCTIMYQGNILIKR